MADIKTATSEGIELQTQPKKATAVQASSADEELIDIGKALDVKEAGRAGDGAVPVVTPDVPQEETTVVDANANKKHRGCVSGVKRKHMRTVAKYLIVSTICVLLATVIGLAIRVSLDDTTIQKFQSGANATVVGPIEHVATFTTSDEMRGTYLEGMPGVFGRGLDLEMADTLTSATQATSTAGVVLTEIFPAATAMVNLTLTATATLIDGGNGTSFSSSVVSMTQAASASEQTVIMPMYTASAVDTVMSSIVPFTSHTCGEWGDGAGPCSRSYGTPNNNPATPAMEPESVFGGSTKLTGSRSMNGSLSSIARTSLLPNATALAEQGSSTTSGCGATTTATIYVTVTPASSNTSAAHTRHTVHRTSTQVTFVTLTIAGADGEPLTTTETVSWPIESDTSVASSTTQLVDSSNGTVTTLSLANFTITVPSETSTRTVSSTTFVHAPTSSTAAIASGGERASHQPLCASTSGGNGVYCAMMMLFVFAMVI